MSESDDEADVAFLSGLFAAEDRPSPAEPPPEAPVQQQLDLTAGRPRPEPMLFGGSSRGGAEAGRPARPKERSAAADRAAAEAATDSHGRWGTTAAAVLVCLLLGAGAFWYWRSNHQIPEGEFTFVETTESTSPEHMGPDARNGGQGVSGSQAALGKESLRDAAESPEARRKSAEESETPGRDFSPPQSGPLLGYSLHVGSFQTYRAAERAARALRAKGHDAFVAPVLLEGKGQWYRVFTGALANDLESQAALNRMKDVGTVPEGTVRATPWALYLGTFESGDAAEAVTSTLASSGISTYVLGKDPVHLYAGAFESAGDAEVLNRQLRDRGFEAALVRRRGGEEK